MGRYFQPIYNVEKHRITGLEALFRARDGKGGFLDPESLVQDVYKRQAMSRLRSGNLSYHSVMHGIPCLSLRSLLKGCARRMHPAHNLSLLHISASSFTVPSTFSSGFVKSCSYTPFSKRKYLCQNLCNSPLSAFSL